MTITGIVNTDVSALRTIDSLGKLQSGTNTSLAQLSTGKQINGPQDNPAGYSISQRMTTQIDALQQNIENANQATSVTQTAMGAMTNQIALLQQIRSIAVQAANASNTTSDREALQASVSQLLSQLNTIAGQTQFNGQDLLTGTFAGKSFQVGPNAHQIIPVSIANTRSAAMGNYPAQPSSGAGTYTLSGAITNQGFAVGQAFTISVGADKSYATLSGGILIASGGTLTTVSPETVVGLNEGSGALLSATTLLNQTYPIDSNTKYVVSSGATIHYVSGTVIYPHGSNNPGISETTSGTYITSGQVLVAPPTLYHTGEVVSVVPYPASGATVQIVSGAPGYIEAYASTANAVMTASGGIVSGRGGAYATSGGILLNSSAGEGDGNFVPAPSSIEIRSGIGAAKVNITSPSESAASIAQSINAVAEQTGVKAQANTSVMFSVSSGSYSFVLSNGSKSNPVHQVNIQATVSGGGGNPLDLSQLVGAINQKTAVTGIAASTVMRDGAARLVLTQSQGENIVIAGRATVAQAGLAAGSTGSLQALNVSGYPVGNPIDSNSGAALIQGVVQFASPQSYAITNAHILGYSSQATGVEQGALSTIDVGTAENAQRSILTIDQAIQYLTEQSGTLGAVQTRIQKSSLNAQTENANLESARSVVEDANLAKATSQLTMYQILQKAGISTLVQEGSLQKAYLKLLP